MRTLLHVHLFRLRVLLASALCTTAVLLAGLSVGAPSWAGARANVSTTAASGTWSIVDSPNSRPTPTDNFPSDVTCVSTTDCWAVGYYNNVSAYQTLIHHWDGASWTVVTSPNTKTTQQNLLRSVTCTSTSDCWAVGSYYNDSFYQTLIEHWDGTSWTIVDSPDTSTTQYNYLLDVSCSSGSDCWAAGYYSNDSGVPQTLTEHWNGTAWTIVSSPNAGASQENILYSLSCVSGQCWAVGSTLNSTTGIYQTLIEQWNGASWNIVTSANTLLAQNNYLYGVTCSTVSDCWAVGYYNNGLTDQTLIERWNGTSWVVVTSPNTVVTQSNRLYGVTCVSALQCWGVGYFNNGTSDQTLIERWDGNSWAIVSSPNSDAAQNNSLKGVACASATGCWTVGSYQNGNVRQALIAHWDGVSWEIVTSPNTSAAQNNTLLGTTCASASDCWAVASYYNGSVQQTLIEHWDGNSWTIVPSPNTSATRSNILYDVACSSTSNCWIVGYHDNGSAFQTLTLHWDGNSWGMVPSPSTSSTQNNFFSDITCTSASDCWAAGYYDNGSAYQTLIEHWDGNSWTIVTSPNTSATLQNRLHGLTCMSAGDCWAVGRYFNGVAIQTLIEHWDGNSWQIVGSPNNGISGENILWGVTCTSSTDCWSVGSYGAGDGTGQPLIEHWDGNSWTITSSPMPTTGQYNYNFLRGITCSTGSNCWAVGYYFTGGIDRTLIEHWDGNAWTIVPSPNTTATQNNFLFGLTCPSAMDCWATGYHYDDSGVLQTLIEHYTAPVSLLQIMSISRVTDGHFMITGQAEPLTPINIQASPDLIQQFETIDSIMSDATGHFQFDDADAATMSQRFYRAVYP